MNIIQQYIAQGEHVHQDFKFEISDVRKIARSLSAFANTEGGQLLVGVKDNGKIAGVSSEEEAYMIEAAGSIYCTPPVTCEIKSYTVEGKTVLVARVPQSIAKPVYVKGEDGRLQAYLRVADENILASAVHLRLWEAGSVPKGEVLPYTPREQELLHVMGQLGPVSLNHLCRKVTVPRHKLISLLAQLVRYGIVDISFVDRQFLFSLK